MEKNYPQKVGMQEILKTAFSYWNRTLFYQVAFSLLYFSLFFLGYFYLFKYFGLWDEMSQHSELLKTDFPAFNKKMEEVALLPQTQSFLLGIFFLFAFLNPLNVGFYKIYRKLDLNEKVTMNDLFAGYLGFDFFKFFGFYLFWMIIFSYANSLLLLGVVWIILTLFSVPLMFFMNVNTIEGIKLTVKGLKQDFSTIVLSVLVATLFSLSGLLLFGVGFLFTFPFWHAMIYTLYQHNFKEND
ncbi:hypothetical protein [Kaistella antarctica]|uniref:Beta-carotene 15,15'-monooxygenase n=2 Tax=Kaistella antarctica TaxID=266748 RepID=A0ABR4TVB3_9FLAO|nr:hypothetical protein [Kaistella antarctica]KEY17893.1 hypothetical protein HY04_04960 [Kaistella antarctica]SEV80857.1 hypothetical protein SAMN05421765_0185 [Kaistella antarctica]